MITDKKFFDLWAKDYDNYLPKIPLYKEMIELIKNILEIKEDSKVLDIGIGTGFVAFSIMKKCKCDMYGIDLSLEMIKKTEEKGKELGYKVKLKQEDAKKLDFPQNFFNAIVSVYTLHHLNDEKGEKLECLKRIYNSLKKEGILAVGDTFVENENIGKERFKEVTKRWENKAFIALEHSGNDAAKLELDHISLVFLKEGEYPISIKKWKEIMLKVGFNNINYEIIDSNTGDFVIYGKK